MALCESTVQAKISQRRAFKMWADLTKLSDFLPSVTDVRPEGDGTFTVTLAIDGRTEETRIALTTVEKHRHLIWRSSKGSRWNGELFFRPVVDGTQIILRIDYAPPGDESAEGYPATWDVGRDLIAFQKYANQNQEAEKT